MPERLAAAAGLADDVDALLLEQAPQAGAEEVVVVDEQDAEGVLLVLRLRCWRLPSRRPPVGDAGGSQSNAGWRPHRSVAKSSQTA